MWVLSSGVATLVQLDLGGGGGGRGGVWPRWFGGGEGRQLDWRVVQVLEADTLDVASIGRAVTAGAEVW